MDDLKAKAILITDASTGGAGERFGRRIRVNAVSPGVVQTLFHNKFSTPEQLETMRQRRSCAGCLAP